MRKGKHPAQHLESFRGVLQVDAYAGFDRLFNEGDPEHPIKEAACSTIGNWTLPASLILRAVIGTPFRCRARHGARLLLRCGSKVPSG